MAKTLRQLADACRRLFERDHGPLPCTVCDGTKIVGIYDISDEYGAPCPICVGVEAYHAKIIRKNYGCLPAELKWPRNQSQGSQGVLVSGLELGSERCFGTASDAANARPDASDGGEE